MAYDSDMNTVFVHKLKPTYINNARTSNYELSGFGETGYMVQINVLSYREAEEDGIHFNLLIEDCRKNPSLSGMVIYGQPVQPGSELQVDPMVNFSFLLELIHGSE
jgi:hypothetical protein